VRRYWAHQTLQQLGRMADIGKKEHDEVIYDNIPIVVLLFEDPTMMLECFPG
jgi:hypothetical protein